MLINILNKEDIIKLYMKLDNHYQSKNGSSVDLIEGESLSLSGYVEKFEVSLLELTFGTYGGFILLARHACQSNPLNNL